MKSTLDEKRDAKTLWLHDFCWGQGAGFGGCFVWWFVCVSEIIRCDIHFLLVLFVYHGLLSFIMICYGPNYEVYYGVWFQLQQLLYTVSSCFFFVWFIFSSPVSWWFPVIERSDHQLQHDFPCWDFVEAHVHPPDLTQPSGNLAHGNEWINETCVNSAWIFRLYDLFLYMLLHREVKHVQTTCNWFVCTRHWYHFLWSQRIVTSMFLDWFCI